MEQKSAHESRRPSQAHPPGAGPLVLGVLIGVLLTVFAVLNLDQLNVDRIVGTWSTPLIVVVIVSLLLGTAFHRCAQATASHRSLRRPAGSTHT